MSAAGVGAVAVVATDAGDNTQGVDNTQGQSIQAMASCGPAPAQSMSLEKAVAFPSSGCVGSIQWGIDTRRAFDIEGIFRYGRLITNADSHADALEITLSWEFPWDDEAFTYIAPKALSVWRIGPKYSYMRSDEKVFAIRMGRAVEIGGTDLAQSQRAVAHGHTAGQRTIGQGASMEVSS